MKFGLLANLILIVALHVGATAAQDFVLAVPQADLSTEQQEALERLSSLPTTESVQLVEVNTELLSGTADFYISLFDDAVLGLQRTEIADRQDDRFSWTGETPTGLAMQGAEEGQASITVNGSSVTGTFWTSEGVYNVRPLGGGLHALVKVQTENFPDEHPPEPQTPPGDVQDLNLSELRPDGDDTVAEIRVLVAYTGAVASEYNDPVGLAQSSIDAANLSYRNSGVRAELILAEAIAVSYVEQGSHQEDLDAMTSKNDGQLDEIHGERDRVAADLVVLLTNDNSYCGMAKQIFAVASTAFATVYGDCAVSNLSFAHEIGHLLGACHDPDASSRCTPFAYGHGFTIPDQHVRTVMAYQCSDSPCQRMPEWSRPPQWGNEELSHDARVLDLTSHRASRFRE